MYQALGTPTANFALDLYSATGGSVPGSLLASFSGETNPDASHLVGIENFVYTIDNYLIEAGTEYFLVASALNQLDGNSFVWARLNGTWGGGLRSTFFLLTLHHKQWLFQNLVHFCY